MESIVLELQREAYQHDTSVSILLRKAYTLSKKLRVNEFVSWANLELNGYKSVEDLPDYRIVHGETKALNPYHGYIPAYFQPEMSEMISKRNILQPITEIETLIKQGDKKDGILMYKFPANVQQSLMKMMEYPLEVSLHIPTSQFQKIIERVRNIILEWTLKLEEEGVFGEGMTFTDREKEKAVNSTTPIINIIGNMTNSQMQQNTSNSTQALNVGELKKEDLKTLISELKSFSEEVKETKIKEELMSEIEILEIQAKSPNPKKGIIGETLKSIRNIAEGTTGSLLATAIQEKIKLILPMLGG